LALAIAIDHWLWLLVIGYAYQPLAIGHRLWLLVIDIYTKKCGYGVKSRSKEPPN
jgi:hypothetical protein